MYFGDKLDHLMELLCTCETYFECDWHKRLRERGATRSEVAEEMEEIVEVSHAIYMGVIEPPPGWGLIRGKRGEYWSRTAP